MTIDELGGLSEAERDKLADDLRRIQDEMGQLGLRNFERAHVTDGSPCWCGPTTIDPDGNAEVPVRLTGGGSGLDRLFRDLETPAPAPARSSELTWVNETGEPVHFQVLGPPLTELPSVNAGGSGVDLWDRELTEDEVRWMHDQNNQLARALEAAHGEFIAASNGIMPDGTRVGEQQADGGGSIDPWDVRELRAQIEAAVERLQYSTDYAGAGQTGARDVLDVEPFLDELGRIFGSHPKQLPQATVAPDARWFEIPGRDGAKGLRVAVGPDGQTHLWPLDPNVNPGFALSGEAARDLEIILRAFLPGDVALAAGVVAALEAVPSDTESTTDPEPPSAQTIDLMEALRASLQVAPRPPMPHPEPEHESAADRRERASARNEHTDGRVEGVDR